MSEIIKETVIPAKPERIKKEKITVCDICGEPATYKCDTCKRDICFEHKDYDDWDDDGWDCASKMCTVCHKIRGRMNKRFQEAARVHEETVEALDKELLRLSLETPTIH